MKAASSSRRLRAPLFVVAGLLLLGLAWVGTHLLADDARPAAGQAHVVRGAPPISYDVLEPQTPTTGTETVVLVASLGRPASDFNELRAALAQAGYRTIAVESRGILSWAGGGFAHDTLRDLAGDMRAALADAGVRPDARVHVIGHAFGNRVARTFATLFPRQTAGLVLIAAGDKTDNMPPAVAHDLRLSTLGFLPWFVREGAVTRDFFAPGDSAPPYWQGGWSTWGAVGQIRAAQAAGSESFNAGGQGPMLVLQAEDDVVAPPRDAGELLKQRYGSRVTLVSIPHAGHAQLPERPELIARSIIAFLRAHPAR